MYTFLKKFLVIALTLGITIFTFSSCSKDIILEPLDSLLGEYTGRYTLTDLSQGSGGVAKAVDISWIFRDFTYGLEVDSAFCSPSGEYELVGDQIKLKELFGGDVEAVCNSEENPYGDFSLRRPADSLILTQIVDNISKVIRLKKVIN